ncbi:hypothetical protein [Mesorhizobium sp. IMUNJ 23232]|uniref:hypothetical protein n=1 Tax=Mesorhizobium sp. IMUNJ 23232 TaxID=3376064 RepID=UPI003790279A
MAPERGWWDEPVKGMLGKSVTVHHVSNNLQAADILLHNGRRRAARSSVQRAKLC